MKKWIFWLLAIVLAIALYLAVYLVPLSHPYFFPGEEIELHYIEKTTLHIPEGETVERYGPVEWSDEDVLDKVDVEALLEKFPDMRVTVYSEYLTSRWVGDVTYEINGVITSGLRKHTHFYIDLGIPEESHLRINGRQWGRRIIDPQQWIALIESLEQVSNGSE